MEKDHRYLYILWHFSLRGWVDRRTKQQNAVATLASSSSSNGIASRLLRSSPWLCVPCTALALHRHHIDTQETKTSRNLERWKNHIWNTKIVAKSSVETCAAFCDRLRRYEICSEAAKPCDLVVFCSYHRLQSFARCVFLSFFVTSTVCFSCCAVLCLFFASSRESAMNAPVLSLLRQQLLWWPPAQIRQTQGIEYMNESHVKATWNMLWYLAPMLDGRLHLLLCNAVTCCRNICLRVQAANRAMLIRSWELLWRIGTQKTATESKEFLAEFEVSRNLKK